MPNGGDGHSNDSFTTLMAALFAMASWVAKFTINRYFDRKDRLRQEKQTREEFRQLLEEDKRKPVHVEKSGFDEEV